MVWHYSKQDLDADGRLATATDPILRSTHFLYDAADRLTSLVLTDGRVVDYGYDTAGNLSGVPALQASLSEL